MFFAEFACFFASRVLTPLLGGVLLAACWQSVPRAASLDRPRVTYVISDQEGYGILDCLTQKRVCGKIVADSWCGAHGHGPALAFGPAEDVTSSIEPVSSRSATVAGAAIVACRD